MSVRKPLEKKVEEEEIDIDALIEKGAKVKADRRKKEKWTYINVRISSKMLEEVDAIVENRIGINRTGWILETIHERILRLKEKK